MAFSNNLREKKKEKIAFEDFLPNPLEEYHVQCIVLKGKLDLILIIPHQCISNHLR